jgi:hypothetical protein
MICSISGLLTCRMAITLCSVGVGTFTGLLPESWPRVCRPVSAGGRGGVQVAVHQRDGGRAFADGGCDPVDRSAAHVAGCEHPGQAGF